MPKKFKELTPGLVFKKDFKVEFPKYWAIKMTPLELVHDNGVVWQSGFNIVDGY